MGSAVTISRRVGWVDTDATGKWHQLTIMRWMMEAENELFRHAGVADHATGATPPVHTEFDFRRPLRFDDEVDITLSVGEIGETSITYLLDVSRHGETVASGRMVSVFIERSTGAARDWPDHLREALFR